MSNKIWDSLLESRNKTRRKNFSDRNVLISELLDVLKNFSSGGGEVREDSDGNFNYIGTAPANSSETSSVWTITRLENNLNGVPTIVVLIDVKWSERLILSY